MNFNRARLRMNYTKHTLSLSPRGQSAVGDFTRCNRANLGEVYEQRRAEKFLLRARSLNNFTGYYQHRIARDSWKDVNYLAPARRKSSARLLSLSLSLVKRRSLPCAYTSFLRIYNFLYL